MRARARIVAVADGRRGTRLAEVRGQAPLLVRRTGPGVGRPTGGGRGDGGPAGGPPTGGGPPVDGGTAGGEAEVHLVGGAAGPLGGDRLRIDVEVGPGASLCVRAVAASLALPARTGARSRLVVTARVGPGGRLRWLPEPLIGAANCNHLSLSMVELAEGATLLWREELVCGRHGERVGDVELGTSVRYAGRALLRSALTVGPRAPGWDGPAVLDGGRATGSVVLVDPSWAATGPPPAAVLGPTAAVMPLAGGPAVLATATGAELAQVRAALDPLVVEGWRAPPPGPVTRGPARTPATV